MFCSSKTWLLHHPLARETRFYEAAKFCHYPTKERVIIRSPNIEFGLIRKDPLTPAVGCTMGKNAKMAILKFAVICFFYVKLL